VQYKDAVMWEELGLIKRYAMKTYGGMEV
jgi:hypothetical protein